MNFWSNFGIMVLPAAPSSKGSSKKQMQGKLRHEKFVYREVGARCY